MSPHMTVWTERFIRGDGAAAPRLLSARCQPKWARNKRLLKRCLRGSLLNCRINAVKDLSELAVEPRHIFCSERSEGSRQRLR